MLQYPRSESITEVVKRIRERGYTAANAHYGIGTRNRWLDASESEIGDVQLRIGIQHQVARFDVAVQHTQVVGMLERFGRLDSQLRSGAKKTTVMAGVRGRTDLGFDLWTCVGSQF